MYVDTEYVSLLTIYASINLLICLFGVLCHFQHCIGNITMGTLVGRGNQYIQLVKVLYCKLTTIGKQLPLTLEVGGECVTTAPPWPLYMPP